uniref:Uncharacterized protein n=1 Tax=Photinus pyralis TaxID=7054 RepID=A0A1Y1NGY4_PHOPY
MDVSRGHDKRGTLLAKDGQEVKKTTRGWIYTCSELDFLRTVPYHYNAWSNSVLERYFFHPLYSHLALHVPLTVPPALLSVLGLVCSCIAAATTIWHASTLSGMVPSWVFYLDAACVMLYHGFDALDGKQAYRIQNSEIEEFYDHGCDSITSVLQTIVLLTALNMTSRATEQLSLVMILLQIAFFLKHYEASVTHTVVFLDIDVTEVQCIVATLLLLTGMYGQGFWSETAEWVPGLHVYRASLPVGIAVAGFSASILHSLLVVFCGYKTQLEQAGIAIPRRPYSYKPLGQAAITTCCAIFAHIFGAAKLDVTLFVLAYGLAFAKISIKLNVLSKARANLPYMDTALVLTTSLTLFYVLALGSGSRTTATCLIACIVVVSVLDILVFSVLATWDFEEARGIKAFKMCPRGKYIKPRCDGFYITSSNLDDMRQQWLELQETEPDLLRALYG